MHIVQVFNEQQATICTMPGVLWHMQVHLFLCEQEQKLSLEVLNFSMIFIIWFYLLFENIKQKVKEQVKKICECLN